MITLLAISGSLRRASSNMTLIQAVAHLAPKDVRVVVYDRLDRLPFFNPDVVPSAEVVEFQHAVAGCDAVVISSPEYAHGVPGVLKNALDWLVGSGEFIDKPVALLNASGRATYAWNSLMETLTVMSARVIEEASIVVALEGSRLDAEAIAAHPEHSSALNQALTALIEAVRVAST